MENGILYKERKQVLGAGLKEHILSIYKNIAEFGKGGS